MSGALLTVLIGFILGWAVWWCGARWVEDSKLAGRGNPLQRQPVVTVKPISEEERQVAVDRLVWRALPEDEREFFRANGYHGPPGA
jgi:hypothetical protein